MQALASVYRSVASAVGACWAVEPEGKPEGRPEGAPSPATMDALRRECRQLYAFLQLEAESGSASAVQAPVDGPACLFCCGTIFNVNANAARTIVAKCGHEAAVCATCAVGARSPLLLTECRACALNSYYE